MIYNYDQLLQHLASNVKTRRKQLGITQEILALDAGIDRTYISQIERGISNPSLLVLVKVAEILDVDVVELLEEPEFPPDRHDTP
jgi:transcriptional regulator with XRE-family HTH domain